jgi:nicotinate-nucleotide adenylyltransferase
VKIGLYFGSFNPIHIGHLIIASHVADHTEMQQVWFVVSPQNPLKPSSVLLNEYHRLHLVHLAIEDDLRLKASEVEFKLPRPSYTIDTLTYLQEKYPQHEFSVIMGSDSFQNLPRWKNFEQLVKNYAFIIYNRPGFEVKDNFSAKLTVSTHPCSSSPQQRSATPSAQEKPSAISCQIRCAKK